MARLTNGYIDFSEYIADMDVALNEYVSSPQVGLERLQSALESLENSQSESFDHLLQLRLTLFLNAIEKLLASGAPYITHYHAAFLSAVDAIVQVALAEQFGLDRFQQLKELLSLNRSCWSLLLSMSEDQASEPVYVSYEAQYTSNTSDKRLDDYLIVLGAVGNVSFSVDLIVEKSITGRFSLLSVQSLSWLKKRFPNLEWQITATQKEKDPLKELCEFNIWPLFQDSSLTRDSRHHALARFEYQFKRLFYQKFSSIFPTDSAHIKLPNRLVPIPEKSLISPESEFASYFPVRCGGFFYIASVFQEKGGFDVVYEERLGADVLPTFLLEIETPAGKFVFDRSESIGRYSLSDFDLHQTEKAGWLASDEEREITVLFDMPIMSECQNPYCLLPDTAIKILVIEQLGRLFAIPYFSLAEVEALCVSMSRSSLGVKNVWVDKNSRSLLEPWLISLEQQPDLYLETGTTRFIEEQKSGWYSGKVFGKDVWVDAELVSIIEPYYEPFSYTESYSGDVLSLLIRDGHCFTRVISHPGAQHAVFAVLEWMRESMVLSFDFCQWQSDLPNKKLIKEVSKPFVDGDVIVIDQTNYLSFVDGFGSFLLMLGSDC